MKLFNSKWYFLAMRWELRGEITTNNLLYFDYIIRYFINHQLSKQKECKRWLIFLKFQKKKTVGYLSMKFDNLFKEHHNVHMQM